MGRLTSVERVFQTRQQMPRLFHRAVLQAGIHDNGKMPDIMAQYFQPLFSGKHILCLLFHRSDLQHQKLLVVRNHLQPVLAQNALIDHHIDHDDQRQKSVNIHGAYRFPDIIKRNVSNDEKQCTKTKGNQRHGSPANMDGMHQVQEGLPQIPVFQINYDRIDYGKNQEIDIRIAIDGRIYQKHGHGNDQGKTNLGRIIKHRLGRRIKVHFVSKHKGGQGNGKKHNLRKEEKSEY